MNRLFISAAHKSSGKTTITLGLCAALRKKGLQVQPFKKGPDYIDPMWLSLAAGRSCYNLDFFTQSHDEINNLFSAKSVGADISIVEGNKGLSDGLDLDGSNSSAALAILLKTPVIMVIDTQGITRSVAPLILGFQKFEPDVTIAGIILNKVGGERHEKKLRSILKEYADIPVLGAIQRDPSLEIVERHLGLVPSNETAGAKKLIEKISNIIAGQVDLDQLLEIAATAEKLPVIENDGLDNNPDITIGIIRDEAFGFYYQDDLEAFKKYGANIKFIDSINDKDIGQLDGLFIGGGFPEAKMQKLEKNTALHESLRTKISNGLPVYAECGGLMYLCNKIQWQGKSSKMLGIIDADVMMHKKPVGRGYVYLQKDNNHPWLLGSNADKNKQPAHEFHYSELVFKTPQDNFCYNVVRGQGIMNKKDGIHFNNVIATYAHQRNTLANPWVNEFINFVRKNKHQE